MPKPAEFSGPGSLQTGFDVFPITPSDVDGDNLESPIRAIRAGGDGDVRGITLAGETRTFSILAGETRYIGMTHVFATGTTATDLEGVV